MSRSPLQTRHAPILTSASRVGLSYLVAGVAWILLSDTVVDALVPDAPTRAAVQTLKGWGFVIASAALIWWLVRREVRRVRSSEARLSALADQGGVGTWVIVDQRLVQVNRRLTEILGYTEADLLGRSLWDLVADEDVARTRDALRRGDAGFARGRRYAFKGRRADGSTIDLEAFGGVIEWDGREAVAGLLLDVTERATLEEKLRQADRVDTLGNLTGAVVHDFNNFLTGIIGNLDLVLSEPGDGSRSLRAKLEMVRDSASRAAALTGQLLTFGRGRVFQHRPIDPNRHLRKLSEFLSGLCEGGQRLVLDLGHSVPSVVLDPIALDQLVVNLFVNARDALGECGTVTLRTQTHGRPGGEAEVSIEVADDGSGIPPAVLHRVFEPFFTTKEHGTGLGLATVRSIVDELRGDLHIESEPGRGTTVRVTVPAAGTAAGSPRRPARPRPVAVSAGADKRTILVVDDDQAVRDVLVSALNRVGHRALAARDRTQAHEALERSGGHVDLVICDLNLGDMQGTQLIEELQEVRPDLRALIMSGTHRSDGEDPSLLDAWPFLNKPFSLSDLQTAIDEALSGSAQRRGSASS